MTLFSFLLNVLLLPFEWLGRLLTFLLSGSVRFLTKFLLSPWGLLLPCTVIAAVLIWGHLSRNASELAENYLQSLESCEEHDVPVLLEAIAELGEAGISALVAGLRQKREAVFTAVRDKIGSELSRWEMLDDEDRQRRYRILSKSLLDQGRSLDDEGQEAAIRLCRRMLRNLALSKGASAERDATAVARNCERLLTAIETRRKKMLAPDGPMNKANAESIARFESRSFDPTLMASMGRPFQRDDINDTVLDDKVVDGFAAPRAERLQAYHDSQQYQKQLAAPYRRPGSVSLPLDRLEAPAARDLYGGEMMASMSPVRRPDPVKTAPDLFRSETQGKVAGLHVPKESSDIARDYLEKNKDAEDKLSRNRASAMAVVSDADFFLPRDLREVPLDRVPDLSSARLMRLLQHNDERYVSEARKTLIARDGFRDTHLKLAFRLFHPAPSVREELVNMLPNSTGVQPRVWLSVLLDDPNSDVRYRAASFLATTGDPSLQRLLIERGKRDTDSRIVNLADRLLEQQGSRGR